MAGVFDYKRFINIFATAEDVKEIFPRDQYTLNWDYNNQGADGWICDIEWMPLLVDKVRMVNGKPNFNGSSVIGYFPGSTTSTMQTATAISLPANMYTGPIYPSQDINVPVTVVNINWTKDSLNFQKQLLLINNWEPGVDIGNPENDANYTPIVESFALTVNWYLNTTTVYTGTNIIVSASATGDNPVAIANTVSTVLTPPKFADIPNAVLTATNFANGAFTATFAVNNEWVEKQPLQGGTYTILTSTLTSSTYTITADITRNHPIRLEWQYDKTTGYRGGRTTSTVLTVSTSRTVTYYGQPLDIVLSQSSQYQRNGYTSTFIVSHSGDETQAITGLVELKGTVFYSTGTSTQSINFGIKSFNSSKQAVYPAILSTGTYTLQAFYSGNIGDNIFRTMYLATASNTLTHFVQFGKELALSELLIDTSGSKDILYAHLVDDGSTTSTINATVTFYNNNNVVTTSTIKRYNYIRDNLNTTDVNRFILWGQSDTELSANQLVNNGRSPQYNIGFSYPYPTKETNYNWLNVLYPYNNGGVYYPPDPSRNPWNVYGATLRIRYLGLKKVFPINAEAFYPVNSTTYNDYTTENIPQTYFVTFKYNSKDLDWPPTYTKINTIGFINKQSNRPPVLPQKIKLGSFEITLTEFIGTATITVPQSSALKVKPEWDPKNWPVITAQNVGQIRQVPLNVQFGGSIPTNAVNQNMYYAVGQAGGEAGPWQFPHSGGFIFKCNRSPSDPKFGLQMESDDLGDYIDFIGVQGQYPTNQSVQVFKFEPELPAPDVIRTNYPSDGHRYGKKQWLNYGSQNATYNGIYNNIVTNYLQYQVPSLSGDYRNIIPYRQSIYQISTFTARMNIGDVVSIPTKSHTATVEVNKGVLDLNGTFSADFSGSAATDTEAGYYPENLTFIANTTTDLNFAYRSVMGLTVISNQGNYNIASNYRVDKTVAPNLLNFVGRGRFLNDNLYTDYIKTVGWLPARNNPGQAQISLLDYNNTATTIFATATNTKIILSSDPYTFTALNAYEIPGNDLTSAIYLNNGYKITYDRWSLLPDFLRWKNPISTWTMSISKIDIMNTTSYVTTTTSTVVYPLLHTYVAGDKGAITKSEYRPDKLLTFKFYKGETMKQQVTQGQPIEKVIWSGVHTLTNQTAVIRNRQEIPPNYGTSTYHIPWGNRGYDLNTNDPTYIANRYFSCLASSILKGSVQFPQTPGYAYLQLRWERWTADGATKLGECRGPIPAINPIPSTYIVNTGTYTDTNNRNWPFIFTNARFSTRIPTNIISNTLTTPADASEPAIIRKFDRGADESVRYFDQSIFKFGGPITSGLFYWNVAYGQILNAAPRYDSPTPTEFYQCMYNSLMETATGYSPLGQPINSLNWRNSPDNTPYLYKLVAVIKSNEFGSYPGKFTLDPQNGIVWPVETNIWGDGSANATVDWMLNIENLEIIDVTGISATALPTTPWNFGTFTYPITYNVLYTK